MAGKKGKPQYRIAQEKPYLVLYISKNGRPVSHGSARVYLNKHFPGKQWKLGYTDHSLMAIEDVPEANDPANWNIQHIGPANGK